MFVSYSHRDKRWLERIRPHLKALERSGRLVSWDDTMLKAGSMWKESISDAIDATKVAILLISADFLASEFIQNVEIPLFWEAVRQDAICLIPVIVSPCRYNGLKIKDGPIYGVQAINPLDRPLTALNRNEQDKIFVKLMQRIEEILELL